ncbi:MAG: hypothetical protein V4608_08935 [Bacteroidota bacterium]
MCKFSLPYSGSSAELILKVKTEINKAGGQFEEHKRTFSFKTPVGEIVGSFVLETSAIKISIEQKPFLVSCRKIEDEMKAYIAKPGTAPSA